MMFISLDIKNSNDWGGLKLQGVFTRTRDLHGLTSRVVGHRSIAPGFKSRPGYVRMVFHLSLRLITVGGRSAHLDNPVHQSVHKTAIFTIFTNTFGKLPDCFLNMKSGITFIKLDKY